MSQNRLLTGLRNRNGDYNRDDLQQHHRLAEVGVMGITHALRGRTVRWVATDEKHLVIGCTDGQEVKIIWGQDGPELAGIGARIILPSVSMVGSAQRIGD